MTLVRKTANESVTSSTSLQNDDHLVLALGANESWEFDAFVFCTSGSNTPDIKFAFTVPTGTTLNWVSEFQEGSTVSNNSLITASGTSVNNAITSGSTDLIRIRGVVTTGANAGNLQFQWAQNSSNGTSTQVLANSYLKAGKF